MYSQLKSAKKKLLCIYAIAGLTCLIQWRYGALRSVNLSPLVKANHRAINKDELPALSSAPRPGRLIDPRFHYNLAMSEWLPLDREVPEARSQACQTAANSTQIKSLPQTSIVIVEVNEADVTLARTVVSVLNRSPNELLADIIIVDDHSDWEVGTRVRSLSPLVKVVRTPQNRPRSTMLFARCCLHDAFCAMLSARCFLHDAVCTMLSTRCCLHDALCTMLSAPGHPPMRSAPHGHTAVAQHEA